MFGRTQLHVERASACVGCRYVRVEVEKIGEAGEVLLAPNNGGKLKA